MPYSQLSDDYYDRPEFLDLSRSALAMTTEALVYSSRSLTDGYVPKNALRRISTSEDPFADAEELVNSGIWEELEHGYQIPWNGQRTKKQVLDDREKDAERKRIERAHKNGNHAECAAWKNCHKKWVAEGKVSTPDSDSDSTTESTLASADHSTPLPSTPEGLVVRGSGSGEVASSSSSGSVAGAPSSSSSSAPKDPAGAPAKKAVDYSSIADLFGPVTEADLVPEKEKGA